MDFLKTENDDEASGQSPLRIGAGPREIRQNRGLTLQQGADRTGFALSFLSLLERDKVSINLENLGRLARFCWIRMVGFFGQEPGAPVFVVRSGELAAWRGACASSRRKASASCSRRGTLRAIVAFRPGASRTRARNRGPSSSLSPPCRQPGATTSWTVGKGTS